MSDTISHATQGGLMLLGPFIAFIRRKVWIWILAVTGAIFGALPDLLGLYGAIVQHDNTLRISAHQGAIAETLQYVPMYWLHLRIDEITHDRHAFVTPEWLWLEAAFWGINIVLIWTYVRVWRRQRARRKTNTEARRTRRTTEEDFG